MKQLRDGVFQETKLTFLVSDSANSPSLFLLYVIQFYQVCTQCKDAKSA